MLCSIDFNIFFKGMQSGFCYDLSFYVNFYASSSTIQRQKCIASLSYRFIFQLLFNTSMTSCKNIRPVLYHCDQASLQMDVDQRTRERRVEQVLLEVISNYDKNSITHALLPMTSG